MNGQIHTKFHDPAAETLCNKCENVSARRHSLNLCGVKNERKDLGTHHEHEQPRSRIAVKSGYHGQ